MKRTNTKVSKPRWPTFTFESLEDRCAFSATPWDAGLATGVQTFVSLPDQPNTGANFASNSFSSVTVNYTGSFLSVPESQTVGRTATLFFQDSVLPGTFVGNDNGRVDIVASRNLAIPQSSTFEVQLASTELPTDRIEYSVLLDTGFAHDSTAMTLDAYLRTTPIASKILQVPPPPVASPPRDTGGGETLGGNANPIPGPQTPAKPQKPPPANEGPTTPSPASPPVRRPVVTLPPIQHAQFEAATTQTTLASPPARIEAVTPSPVQQPATHSTYTVTTNGLKPPRQEPELQAEDRPVVLELVAAREVAQSPQRERLELLVLPHGVEVVPQPVPTLSDEANEVLARIAARQPELPFLASTQTAPLDQSERSAETGNATYLYLALLVGLGTGHYFGLGGSFSGRRETATRRELWSADVGF